LLLNLLIFIQKSELLLGHQFLETFKEKNCRDIQGKNFCVATVDEWKVPSSSFVKWKTDQYREHNIEITFKKTSQDFTQLLFSIIAADLTYVFFVSHV
jgi:hypothetical protein